MEKNIHPYFSVQIVESILLHLNNLKLMNGINHFHKLKKKIAISIIKIKLDVNLL
jgi:hypothetical protein